MSTRRNTPTERGRELGRLLGAMTDRAEIEVRQRFPNHTPRCKSCAFTAGTFPNGCEETLLDAIKCVANGDPFYCHQRFGEDGSPQDLCAGWAIATADIAEARRERLKQLTEEWEYTKP